MKRAKKIQLMYFLKVTVNSIWHWKKIRNKTSLCKNESFSTWFVCVGLCFTSVIQISVKTSICFVEFATIHYFAGMFAKLNS